MDRQDRQKGRRIPNGVPDLGGSVFPDGQMPKVGASFAGLARTLDEHGVVEADKVLRTPQGMKPVLARSSFVDAEELVEMIRQVVVEALENMRKEGGFK